MSVKINASPTVMTIQYDDEPIVKCRKQNIDTDSGEEDSISSEESGGLGNDSDHRVRAKSIQEIWEEEVIWDNLQVGVSTVVRTEIFVNICMNF